MATNIDPKRDARQLEQENFAYQGNGSDLTKVVRRVEDEEASGLLAQILAQLGGTSGTPVLESDSDLTTPGFPQTLISRSVAVGTELVLRSVRVTCRRPVTYKILIDSDVVGSGRVGPGKLNDDFIFNIDVTALAGQTVKVEVTATAGPASDIEVYLQALEQ